MDRIDYRHTANVLNDALDRAYTESPPRSRIDVIEATLRELATTAAEAQKQAILNEFINDGDGTTFNSTVLARIKGVKLITESEAANG